MPKIKQVRYPTLEEYIYQEVEGMRRIQELGWRGALGDQFPVLLSAEQGENLLMVGGAIRKDILVTIRLQLDASEAWSDTSHIARWPGSGAMCNRLPAKRVHEKRSAPR